LSLSDKAKEYSIFIQRARKASSGLFQTAIVYGELAHLIEKTEREIFERAVRKIDAKEYRYRMLDERKRVVEEIETAWTQVESMASGISIDAASLSALARPYLAVTFLDGYDGLNAATLSQLAMTQVITDDADFATVEGLEVFTANTSIIAAARENHRLRVRSAPKNAH
jgi:hypothetical protein